MSQFSKTIYYRLPVAAFCIAIYWQSSRPGMIPTDIPHTDKLLHALAYALLAFLATRWLHIENRPKSRKTAIILAFLFTTLYGLSDEIHQYFVPGRFASSLDFIADMTGAAIFTLACFLKKIPTQTCFLR